MCGHDRLGRECGVAGGGGVRELILLLFSRIGPPNLPLIGRQTKEAESELDARMHDSLSILQRSLTEAVLKNADAGDIDPQVFSERFMKMFELVRPVCEASSLQAYLEKAPEVLEEYREADAGFRARNFERWKPSFDHLEMMWSVAQELGEMHGKVMHARDCDNDTVMAALAHIFPRALLVSQEIICLLKGGFPDGALARWRSLHELSVTAIYISKHGEAAAVPYLLSFHFAARRAAHQLNEHSERAKIDRVSEAELKELDARCAAAEKILGREVQKDKDGEWPAIMKNHKNFAAIEKDVEMDHWRPSYKWASTHTHANHRPMDKLLGVSETGKELHLIGASNSGLVDPFRMTAISLTQITTTYLFHGVNVDRIVHAGIMQKLSDQMFTISMENERLTREAFQAKKGQSCSD